MFDDMTDITNYQAFLRLYNRDLSVIMLCS